MDIMPAGVHDTRMCGFVGHIIGFLYGQCVHIGTQGYGFPLRSGSLDRRNDPGTGYTSLEGDSYTVKFFLDKARGLFLFEGKLRITM